LEISAKTLAKKIEQKVIALTQALESAQREKITEHASALKAYCELLLAEEKSEETRHNFVPKPLTDREQLTSEKRSDSLLDF